MNSGLVSNPGDMYNLLRPLLKQTVSYRYSRGGTLISRGTGWVERVVVDRPSISTFFTPLSICVNIDSWEHLEFETRPDQLLVYTLVQGDERVIVEYAATNPRPDADASEQQAFRFGPVSGDYVQMELGTLTAGDGPAAEAGSSDAGAGSSDAGRAGRGPAGDAPPSDGGETRGGTKHLRADPPRGEAAGE